METGIPHWWADAKEFLSKDKIMSQIIPKYPNESLVGRGDIFYTFVRSIIGQQISVIAADAIWERLVNKVGEITPQKNSTIFSRRNRIMRFNSTQSELHFGRCRTFGRVPESRLE